MIVTNKQRGDFEERMLDDQISRYPGNQVYIKLQRERTAI